MVELNGWSWHYHNVVFIPVEVCLLFILLLCFQPVCSVHTWKNYPDEMERLTINKTIYNSSFEKRKPDARILIKSQDKHVTAEGIGLYYTSTFMVASGLFPFITFNPQNFLSDDHWWALKWRNEYFISTHIALLYTKCI